MDFDERDCDPEQGIAQRDARMRVGTRIDDDKRDPAGGGVDRIENGGFCVTLESLEFMAETAGRFRRGVFDLAERRRALGFGFPPAKQVQVGSVNQQDARHGRRVRLSGCLIGADSSTLSTQIRA